MTGISISEGDKVWLWSKDGKMIGVLECVEGYYNFKIPVDTTDEVKKRQILENKPIVEELKKKILEVKKDESDGKNLG